MGDTFEECMDNIKVIQYKSKVEMINEYMIMTHFLFCDSEGMESKSWQGKLVHQQRMFKREIKTVKALIQLSQKENRLLIRSNTAGITDIKNKTTFELAK
eukprot:CAMPEP_0116878962 /NCGR_PEP_ID=MMETSP0463-20121206/10717_1 /TAXON_ID=181622 /ORGANISM="Strombidinopsis sp, Strain SopsisLIS2011" /LENGTH=99 /DNA_ID=CAMNT_0004527717 /DNA_START=361 /DNA_END=660 /DNA_ORIENTATION=-